MKYYILNGIISLCIHLLEALFMKYYVVFLRRQNPLTIQCNMSKNKIANDSPLKDRCIVSQGYEGSQCTAFYDIEELQ